MNRQQLQQILDTLNNRSGADALSKPRYPADTAGRLMDSGVFSINGKTTVSEAIEQIRTSRINKDIDTIYVVDDEGKYTGQVLIRRLLISPEESQIGGLIENAPLFVRADTHKTEVWDRFGEHNYLSMPVLDESDRLVGWIGRNGNGDGE